LAIFNLWEGNIRTFDSGAAPDKNRVLHPSQDSGILRSIPLFVVLTYESN
jgi:hypothetical protein